MSDNRERLVEAIDAFMADQSKENKLKMVDALVKNTVFLPGVFPPGTDLSKLPKPTKPGEKLALPKGVQPMPAILKNGDGEMFLPAYISPDQVPKEQKPQIMMNMPFMALVTMALQNPKVSGIAVNPFKQNILLKEPLLKALKEDEKRKVAAAGAAGVRNGAPITPEQAKIILRRKIETELLPKALFEDPKGFTDALCDDQEKFLRSQYEKAYQSPGECPYQESDFSVMPLNIREDLLLVRLDLPPVKTPAPVAVRAYVLYSEETGRADYYTIELTREKGVRKIGKVKQGLSYEDIGEAPTEGVELQRMLDLYDFYANGGN